MEVSWTYGIALAKMSALVELSNSEPERANKEAIDVLVGLLKNSHSYHDLCGLYEKIRRA